MVYAIMVFVTALMDTMGSTAPIYLALVTSAIMIMLRMSSTASIVAMLGTITSMAKIGLTASTSARYSAASIPLENQMASVMAMDIASVLHRS